jgi:D-arabinose 1-dehydrogenase-like Zn-dependent alcohol dehydrogenase
MTRGLREIFDMVDRGILKPVYPVTTYPISQIEDAFRLIAARKHTGKLVLVADSERTVGFMKNVVVVQERIKILS